MPLTAQQSLDMLVGLSKAGKFPAKAGGDGACVLRTGEGLRCAVGAHIPDEAYSPKMEDYGYSFGQLCYRFPEVLSFVPEGLDKDDMNAMRMVHDDTSRKWDHDEFVRRLLTEVPGFRGLLPTPTE